MATATQEVPVPAKSKEPAKQGACRHCGAKLSLLQRLSKQEFCSPDHRNSFLRRREQLALASLQGVLTEVPSAEPQAEVSSVAIVSDPVDIPAPAADAAPPQPIDLAVGDDFAPPDVLLKSALQQARAHVGVGSVEEDTPAEVDEPAAEVDEPGREVPISVVVLRDNPVVPADERATQDAIEEALALAHAEPPEAWLVPLDIWPAPVTYPIAVEELLPLPELPALQLSLADQFPVPKAGRVAHPLHATVLQPLHGSAMGTLSTARQSEQQLAPRSVLPEFLKNEAPEPCDLPTVALPSLNAGALSGAAATGCAGAAPPAMQAVQRPRIEVKPPQSPANGPPVPPHLQRLVPIAGPAPVTAIFGFRRQTAVFSPAAAMPPVKSPLANYETPMSRPQLLFSRELLHLGIVVTARAPAREQEAINRPPAAARPVSGPINRLPVRESRKRAIAGPCAEARLPARCERLLALRSPALRRPVAAAQCAGAREGGTVQAAELFAMDASIPAAAPRSDCVFQSSPTAVARSLASAMPVAIPDKDPKTHAHIAAGGMDNPFEPVVPRVIGSLTGRSQPPSPIAGPPRRRGMLRAALPLRDPGAPPLTEPFPCPFATQEDAWQPEL